MISKNPRNPALKCCRRVDLDGWHNRRDKLEENDEVEVDAHTLDLLLSLGGGGLRYILTACSPREPPLLVGRVGRGRGRFSRGILLSQLLGDNRVVHALDDLLHHARVFARMHGRGLEGSAVQEGLYRHRLVRVLSRDVLEDLGRSERRAVLSNA
jgi:hypothetical protein